MSDAPFLAVEGITKSFGATPVLQNIALEVERGRIAGLIGPNGSGKSTLFNIITGFEVADGGRVMFAGERIDGELPHAIARRGLMRTFQLSEGGLRLTALENLLVAAKDQEEQRLLASLLHPRRVLAREAENLEKAKAALDLLGLRQAANEYLGNLSGGQRKLIDIGRMLMARPKLCLFDEPTAGVNPTLINTILDGLKRMNREESFSIFVIEHNMRVVSEICDWVFVLAAGQIIARGTPEAIRSDPQVLQSYLGAPPAALAAAGGMRT
ncbi:MAG: ABC transporter ATP-binding protein [Pseudolabrys sp.]|nr:ABC transporter ATP-binding protein [Pseudolabrys sp.]